MMLNGGQERKLRLIRVYGVSSQLLLGFVPQPNLQIHSLECHNGGE